MYTLRVPFIFKLDERDIEPSRVDESFAFEDLLLSYNRLEGRRRQLEISGFRTACDAKGFLPRLWAGLAFVLLRSQLPIAGSYVARSPTSIDVAETTNPVFRGDLKVGDKLLLIPYNETVVFPTTERPLTLVFPECRTLLTMKYQSFADGLRRGLTVPKAAELTDDGALTTAVDLYAAHLQESSSRARLITLVTALEVLAERRERSKPLVDMIEKFASQVDETRRTGDFAVADREISSFMSALANLKWRSKKGSVRELLSRCDTGLNDDALDEFLSRVYRWRGKVVHGYATAWPNEDRDRELDTTAGDAERIARLAIGARFGFTRQELLG